MPDKRHQTPGLQRLQRDVEAGELLPLDVYVALYPDESEALDAAHPVNDAREQGRRLPYRPGAQSLNHFLDVFFRDALEGPPRPLGEYLSIFPECGTLVAEVFAAIENASPDFLHTLQQRRGVAALPRAVAHFRPLRVLGEGGFGRVYLAADGRVRRLVALKVLRNAFDESARRYFRHEAEILGRLDHPGLCQLLDLGLDGDLTWIAMRYVPGETLRDWLERTATDENGSARIQTLVALIEKTARALHAAHEAKLVHRDIKPGNIMVTPMGEPVILDFGLARAADDRERSLTSLPVGTPAYMAPEQHLAPRVPLDHRCDLWSLGVVLFEALCGRKPFEAADQVTLLQAVMHREPPRLRDLVPRIAVDLETVVAKTLEKDRDRRYQTALDFAEDLRRVRERQPILARPVGPLGRLLRWAQRNPSVAVLTALVVLSLSAGLGLALSLYASAKSERDRAEEGVLILDRLTDSLRLERLLFEAREEPPPPMPEGIPAMEAWIARARALHGRLPAHEQTLDLLASRARPYTIDQQQRDRKAHSLERLAIAVLDSEIASAKSDDVSNLRSKRAELAARSESRVTFSFDDDRQQLQHDRLRDLIVRLRDLENGDAEKAGTIAWMSKRLTFAGNVMRETIAHHEENWQRAIKRVAENHRYRGLILAPQIGFIPLGPDRGSGLEEFAETRTGTIPVRNTEGTLELGNDSALVFVLIPGGRFSTTVPSDDLIARDLFSAIVNGIKCDVRSAAVAPFLLSKFEMTEDQWRRSCGAIQHVGGSLSLVESVFKGKPIGWFSTPIITRFRNIEVVIESDAGAFSSIDSSTLGYPAQCGWAEANAAVRTIGIRLPTIDEWEYGCRAGTTTLWSVGETKELKTAANVLEVPELCALRTVGELEPNGFGLHDMHGNLAEWCGDRLLGIWPVTRGGGFRSQAWEAESGRVRVPDSNYPDDVGLRPAASLRH